MIEPYSCVHNPAIYKRRLNFSEWRILYILVRTG